MIQATHFIVQFFHERVGTNSTNAIPIKYINSTIIQPPLKTVAIFKIKYKQPCH